MRLLKDEIIHFLKNQGFVTVTSIDAEGFPHNSCKDIVFIDDKSELIYLFDAYKGKTYYNLGQNKKVAVTSVDEHKFIGYSIKGKAKIVKIKKLPDYLRIWEEKISARISKRLIKNIKGEKGHKKHPEILLPNPEYLIAIKPKEVIDLTPRHLREELNETSNSI